MSGLNSKSCPRLTECNKVNLCKKYTAKDLKDELKNSHHHHTEDLEDYRRHGYMPISTGQYLGPSDKFIVLRKLGYGTFSTVWLCRDTKSRNIRAIKITMGGHPDNGSFKRELQNMKHISQRAQNHEGRNLVLLMEGFFKEKSIYGRHMCFCFAPMGPSCFDLLSLNKYKGFNSIIVKTIIRQVLQALLFLHGNCQLIHGDIKAENVLTVVDSVYINNMAEYAELFFKLNIQKPKTFVSALEWKHYMDNYGCQNSLPTGEAIRQKNTHMVTQQSGSAIAHLLNRHIRIKLSDFGYSFIDRPKISTLIQSRAYRALEVLLVSDYSYPIDIWSVGCLAYLLATGQYLFTATPYRMWSVDEVHIAQIWRVLKGIPRHVAKRGRLFETYFNARGSLKYVDVRTLEPWTMTGELKKYHFNHFEAIHFKKFVYAMLEPDAKVRVTPAAALKLEWLNQV